MKGRVNRGHDQKAITSAARQWCRGEQNDAFSAQHPRLASSTSPMATSSPISALPPELLADIFVRCVPVTPRKVQTNVSWLYITVVSKFWRSVALACPELWSTVVLSRPTWTDLFLDRSKTVPIVVRGDLSAKVYPLGIKSFLCDHASRLGTLDIRGTPWALNGIFSNLNEAGSAPRIQDIRIINIYPHVQYYGDKGARLPTDLFGRRQVTEGQYSPGLSLHLVGCAFPWDSAWYSNLTHLHLEEILMALRPTMETLLFVIAGSKNLECLTLINCGPTTSTGCIINLPRLSRVIYKTESNTCAPLLLYLALPPSATLYAACWMLANEEGAPGATYHPVWDSYPSAYDTVRIVHCEKGTTYILRDTARPWWRRKFRAYEKSSIYTITWAVDSVSTHLDFTRITTLHLHTGVPEFTDTISMWRVLGRGMPCVRALHLYDAFPPGWLEFMLTQAMYVLGLTHFRYALYGLAYRASPDTPPPHAWPSLQRLGLHSIDLGESEDAHPGPAFPADLLAALLWARREGGSRICGLEIDEECENVLPQALWRFRLFADVVCGIRVRSGVVERDVREECPRVYSLGVFERMVTREGLQASPSPSPPPGLDITEAGDEDS
ncbi:hypothetical protein FB45DRAFT_32097 [Roridomyces roridus]|uniref:F-box domain-containing protein n=1 Tax=Roridomyces roridus TaxID=1738132 RepID=A0AAD7CL08_9AGAR|nr:hypothetical protein FB45DRAFT_32097 [Roridomyces roridus]